MESRSTSNGNLRTGTEDSRFVEMDHGLATKMELLLPSQEALQNLGFEGLCWCY